VDKLDMFFAKVRGDARSHQIRSGRTIKGFDGTL
jgi:hypothetical protein